MLISESELIQYGAAVVEMLEDENANPEPFWTISAKIIHGIIQSNKKMVKFTSDWKDTCEFNALLKLANNCRKFDISRFKECQASEEYKKYKKLWSLEKAIYEYYHLMAVRNIYNSIRDLTKEHDTRKSLFTGSSEIDIADTNAIIDFFNMEDRVDAEWLEKRVGFTVEEENDDE